MWVGITQSFEDLKRKRQTKVEFTSDLGDLVHLLPRGFLVLRPSTWTGIYRFGFWLSGLQTPPLALLSPGCSIQILGLLSFHNGVSQYLAINLLLDISVSIHPFIHLSLFYWFCFFEKL